MSRTPPAQPKGSVSLDGTAPGTRRRSELSVRCRWQRSGLGPIPVCCESLTSPEVPSGQLAVTLFAAIAFFQQTLCQLPFPSHDIENVNRFAVMPVDDTAWKFD